jgi:hypothetical protein
MSVETGGETRGLFGRWLMRVEAAGGVLRIGFLGVTAASTFTSALIQSGYEDLALPALVGGSLASAAFAYGYVELGVFNRKNRERKDRGDNFAAPNMAMHELTRAAAIGAAIDAHQDGDARDAAEKAALERLQEFRDGVDVDRVFSSEVDQ